MVRVQYCTNCQYHHDYHSDPRGEKRSRSKGHECPFETVEHERSCHLCFNRSGRSKINHAKLLVKKGVEAELGKEVENLKQMIRGLSPMDPRIHILADALLLQEVKGTKDWNNNQ